MEAETEPNRSPISKIISDRSHTSAQNISPSNSIDRSSGTSTPTLTKTISIPSVFSRSHSSQHRDSITGHHSILDRLTSEAKDMAREAKAVAKEVVNKPATQATKKNFLAKLQDLGEPMKGSAKEFWKLSKDESDSDNAIPQSSSSSSIMSTMSSDFNGMAEKTAEMLSGFFSKSNFAKVKEKTQPFGPFPKGKKGLIEKSNLIKHTSGQVHQQNVEQKNQNHSDNQLFLRELVNSVLEGDGIGWLKLSRLKKLMEDEQYRSLIIQQLNKSLPRKIGPDDHLEDVQITRNIWKGLLKLLNAMIYGLEQNYFHHGSSSGMASAFTILEIAHTHFWVKEMTAEEKISMTTTTASCSQTSTPFGSNENLSKIENIPGIKQPQQELNPRNETSGNVKKNQLSHQLISFESELSDASPSCNASEAGSLTVNPIFGTKLFNNSFRSTYSDSEIEVILDLIFIVVNFYFNLILI